MSKLYDYSNGLENMETQVGLPAIPHQQFVTPIPGMWGEVPVEESGGDKIVPPPPPSPAYMGKLTILVLLGLTILVVIGTLVIGVSIIR